MSYPNFKDKHLQEALFHPMDFVNYKKFPKNLPKKYIITYQAAALDFFKRKYNPRKVKLYSLLTVYIHGGIGFVKMSGIGSPNAASVFEELVALGGRIFLNLGTAGGLNHEGVFLCNKALRDEGTSYHYVKEGKFAFPDEKLTEQFGKSIEEEGMEYFEGTTWTIDAPYRETRAEVEKYAKKGISTVEMEASALFVVAKYRKVKIASAFVVSDLLGKAWTPKFHRFNIKRMQNKLVDAAIKCLTKK